MDKVAFILFVSFLAINSGNLLPQRDFVKPNSPENINRLQHIGPNDLAEELSGQFEGDIVIPPEELEELLSGRGGRTGLLNERYRWPDNIIPYEIRDGYFDTAQKNYITLGVQKLMDVTCLKFVPYDPKIHTNYVYITGANTGCHSMVGMRGGGQQLNLQPNSLETGCFRLYTIVHEFMHAIGFYHMQSATERDQYVKIVRENIEPGKEHNFNTYDSTVISQYGVEYDYGSVMHYSKTAFSINGEDTIVPIRDLGDNTMGQRLRMSDKDVARINAKYCPYVPERRPIKISELFNLMNKRMNNLFQTIFG